MCLGVLKSTSTNPSRRIPPCLARNLRCITLATRMSENIRADPLPWGVGRVEKFELHQQHWPAYEARVTQYFVANGVTGVEVEGGSDTRKVAIFLTIIGPNTYRTFRDLAAPAN